MRQRSSYPKPFKTQVVQECLQPGATISSVAIHHGIDANVIRNSAGLHPRTSCTQARNRRDGDHLTGSGR
ncbi:transposase [Pseudomonas sp. P2757]|uniref:transposase n=1 Tax=unclassified Pseudomonas TaxID=196821 RepID=UPI003B596D55